MHLRRRPLPPFGVKSPDVCEHLQVSQQKGGSGAVDALVDSC